MSIDIPNTTSNIDFAFKMLSGYTLCSMSYWVYILECSNNSYYTGYTTDLMRRYHEHVSGTAKCKYTRSFKPLGVAQSWQILGDKATAMQVEKFIKKLNRKKKKQLILHPETLWYLLCSVVY
ncbi:GIY-YIG nuclease family protein [Coxiella burnetii]|uniref:GIY-YIG nuclease family protein n=1 Tax=Coxiella burnetii TaxID=777 RepID=UPI00097C31A3|nr:GIY-YIG nuclease family protein [Coxiella burnetii]UYK68919.1 GIY-YIG nuclease family protein [Coxiella burnetii]